MAEAAHRSADSAPPPIETPSGKGSGDENFPVGSFLLPARLRPHVASFYAYARAIDDIADNPALEPGDKVVRLDGFDKALLGETDDPAFAKAFPVRETCAAMSVALDHPRDLIVAFKQDATKLRYRDWADLRHYCRHSASPVGRFLLDLHGESRDAYPASDALCDALQVINHLQDCKSDYQSLNRVYLPLDWMGDCRVTVEQLSAAEASPGLRTVLDRCLDATAELMVQARQLPKQLRSRRLAMESAAICRIADALIARLRKRDPIAGRVQLSRPEFLGCSVAGALPELFRSRRHIDAAQRAHLHNPGRKH